MIEIVMESIVCAFELYMLFDFGKNILDLRDKNTVFRVIVPVLFFLGNLLVNSFESSMLNFLMIPTLYTAFSLTSFSGTILKRTCIGICYYAIVILPEFIFTVLINGDSRFYYRLEQQDIVIIFVLILIMKTITFMLIKLIEHMYRHKYNKSVQDKIFISLLVLPMATVVILGGIFYSDIMVSSEKARGFLLIGAVLLIFSNGFMFYLFDSMLMNLDKVQKLERLWIKSNMEKKYFKQLNKADEERRQLLHDVNHYLRTAANCIAMDNIQGAKVIFEKLSIKIKETKPAEFCTNRLINIILTDRMETFKKGNIDLKIEIESDVDFSFMEEIDIIAILGNLLDNAFEAAEKCEEKGYAKLKIYEKNRGHFLLIYLENNYDIEPRFQNHIYETTKADKRNHGIGLHTVERIVESYGGRMMIEKGGKEKIFCVTIIFQR